MPRWQIRKQTLIAIEHADKSCPNHPDIIIQTIYTNVTQAKWNLNLSLDFPWFSSTDFLVSSQFRTSERLQRVSKSLTAKEREEERDRELQHSFTNTGVYMNTVTRHALDQSSLCTVCLCVFVCVWFSKSAPNKFFSLHFLLLYFLLHHF